MWFESTLLSDCGIFEEVEMSDEEKRFLFVLLEWVLLGGALGLILWQFVIFPLVFG